MPAMIQAVVFDFDGVIVDSEPLHYRAFLAVAQTLGINFTYAEYLERYIGYDDRDAFRVMLQEHEPHPDPAGHLATLCQAKGDAFEALVRQGVQAFPGVTDFIRHAAASVPIAIASGATRRDIDLILSALGLDALFQTIVSADMVAHSKPDPQTYAMAVQALSAAHPQASLTPGTCVAIEDTAAGIESARLAGLWVIGITTSSDARELHRAHRVIDSLEGLTLPLIRGWFS